MLSSQARANSGQHGSSPRAAVRRTLEQASVGASSCLLLDTARSPWAPAQAPRVARVATLGLSTPPVAMESQGWRAAAQLDVVEAGPLPCVACVDAGSRFPCIIVSYRDQCNTQRACTPYPPPSRAGALGCRGRAAPRRAPPQPRALAATLAVTTHIDTIQYTTHNSSKFGAGAQTAAPGSRSTDYTRPTRPRHRRRRVGV
jgi:hypothetical protein